MKKILVLMANANGRRNSKTTGGAEINTIENIISIDDLHWTVCGTSQVFNLLGNRVKDSTHITLKSIGLIFTKFGIFGSLIFGFYYSLRAIFFGLKHRKNFDAIYASTTNFSDIFPAFVVSMLTKLPLFTKYHISIYSGGSLKKIFNEIREEKNGYFESLVRSFFAYCTINIIKICDGVFCTCSYNAQQLIKCGVSSKKIKVNYLGFNIEEITSLKRKYATKNKKYDICFLGRIEENKGIDDILNLVLFLKNKGNLVNVVILGDGTYLHAIKRKANNLDIKDQITFTGFVGGEEKYTYLSNSHIFIAPSYAKEGFGMTLFEAGYFGSTVIAYNNPIFNEVYGDIPGFHIISPGLESLINKYTELSNKKPKAINTNLLEQKFSLKKNSRIEYLFINQIINESR